MSKYTIVIHAEKLADEAIAAVDAAAKDLVADLKALGHKIHHATITHGDHAHLDGADEDNSGDTKSAA